MPNPPLKFILDPLPPEPQPFRYGPTVELANIPEVVFVPGEKEPLPTYKGVQEASEELVREFLASYESSSDSTGNLLFSEPDFTALDDITKNGYVMQPEDTGLTFSVKAPKVGEVLPAEAAAKAFTDLREAYLSIPTWVRGNIARYPADIASNEAAVYPTKGLQFLPVWFQGFIIKDLQSKADGEASKDSVKNLPSLKFGLWLNLLKFVHQGLYNFAEVSGIAKEPYERLAAGISTPEQTAADIVNLKNYDFWKEMEIVLYGGFSDKMDPQYARLIHNLPEDTRMKLVKLIRTFPRSGRMATPETIDLQLLIDLLPVFADFSITLNVVTSKEERRGPELIATTEGVHRVIASYMSVAYGLLSKERNAEYILDNLDVFGDLDIRFISDWAMSNGLNIHPDDLLHPTMQTLDDLAYAAAQEEARKVKEIMLKADVFSGPNSIELFKKLEIEKRIKRRIALCSGCTRDEVAEWKESEEKALEASALSRIEEAEKALLYLTKNNPEMQVLPWSSAVEQLMRVKTAKDFLKIDIAIKQLNASKDFNLFTLRHVIVLQWFVGKVYDTEMAGNLDLLKVMTRVMPSFLEYLNSKNLREGNKYGDAILVFAALRDVRKMSVLDVFKALAKVNEDQYKAALAFLTDLQNDSSEEAGKLKLFGKVFFKVLSAYDINTGNGSLGDMLDNLENERLGIFKRYRVTAERAERILANYKDGVPEKISDVQDYNLKLEKKMKRVISSRVDEDAVNQILGWGVSMSAVFGGLALANFAVRLTQLTLLSYGVETFGTTGLIATVTGMTPEFFYASILPNSLSFTAGVLLGSSPVNGLPTVGQASKELLYNTILFGLMPFACGGVRRAFGYDARLVMAAMDEGKDLELAVNSWRMRNSLKALVGNPDFLHEASHFTAVATYLGVSQQTYGNWILGCSKCQEGKGFWGRVYDPIGLISLTAVFVVGRKITWGQGMLERYYYDLELGRLARGIKGTGELGLEKMRNEHYMGQGEGTWSGPEGMPGSVKILEPREVDPLARLKETVQMTAEMAAYAERFMEVWLERYQKTSGRSPRTGEEFERAMDYLLGPEMKDSPLGKTLKTFKSVSELTEKLSGARQLYADLAAVLNSEGLKIDPNSGDVEFKAGHGEDILEFVDGYGAVSDRYIFERRVQEFNEVYGDQLRIEPTGNAYQDTGAYRIVQKDANGDWVPFRPGVLFDPYPGRVTDFGTAIPENAGPDGQL